MEIADRWLEDEVRCGFYVPSLMKRLWSAHLQILEDLGKVSRRHGLRWFLAGGNMLGAVRHHGYIPWDDDMDIRICREDYNRLLNCMEEFPKGYRILDPTDDDNLIMTCLLINTMQPRILATDATMMERFHGYPFPCHIDLLVIDPLLEDPEEESMRKDLALSIQLVVSSMNAGAEEETQDDGHAFPKPAVDTVPAEECYSEEECKQLLAGLRKLYGAQWGPGEPTRKQLMALLLSLAEHGLKGTNANNHFSKKYWAPYCSYAALDEKGRLYELIRNLIDVPYEMASLPIPSGYDQLLTDYFGDYMTPKKAKSYHDFPSYRLYEQAAIERFGKKWVFNYSFSPEDLRNDARESRVEPEKPTEELLAILEKLQGFLCDAAAAGDGEAVVNCLNECQNAAQTLGTLLEDTAVGGMSETVSMLEDYCEAAYQAAAALLGGESGE